MFVAVLITLLVILSGIIAYVGDWLGSYVGKKRLSLFGTRPKRTGKIIGIGAGIAIMLVTLGVLYLAFNNAWRIIFQRQEALETVQILQAQERSLSSKVSTLEAQLEDLEAQNATFREENTTLLANNKDLDEAKQNLSNEVANKTAEVRSLEQNVEKLSQDLEEQARDLAVLSQQIDARGDLAYRDGELIASTVIYAQDTDQINTELANFIQATNNLTAQSGAGEVVLDSDQFSSLVAEASATSSPDVIVLRSENNQFGSAPLAVNIESFENQKVYVSGQLLVSLPIILQDQVQFREVRNEVIKLWQMAKDKLLNVGVIDNVSPESYLEGFSTEGFTNQLLRLSGQGKMSIGLIVSQDIYIGGPAYLELVILN